MLQVLKVGLLEKLSNEPHTAHMITQPGLSYIYIMSSFPAYYSPSEMILFLFFFFFFFSFFFFFLSYLIPRKSLYSLLFRKKKYI